MKKLAGLIFILVACLAEFSAFGANFQKRGADYYDTQDDVPARTTVIELNPQENAKLFQIKILPHDKVWAAPYVFDVPVENPKLRIRLTPGTYGIATRTIDPEGFYGPWSDWRTFSIHYTPSDSYFPADNSQIRPKSGISERISFEWPESPGARGYRFVLRSEDGKIIRDENVRNTWSYQELELATSYSWAVAPYGSKEELTFHNFRVQGPQPGTRDIIVHAAEVPRAVKYQFEFLKLDRLGERGSASIYESKMNTFPVAVAPGAYEVRVRTYFSDKSISDWSPPWSFVVPYEKVKQLLPKNGLTISPRDDVASPVALKWDPQADVHHYTVYFYDDKGNYFQQAKTETNSITVGLPHDRKYRWLVIPYPAGQREIKPPEMPEDAPSFSISRYYPLKLAKAEEPSYLYGWGRYYTSVIDYQANNYDLNSRVAQPIYGGTGEIAFGFWHRRTQLGILIHAGLSGFLLGGKNYRYSNAGVDLGYRHISDSGSRLRVWLGAAYVEAPEFLRDPYLKNMDYRLIKSWGPQLQISYMDNFKFNPNYGWHTFATVYRSQNDLGTPNGLPQVPKTSYTLGLYGTYLYNMTTKFMIGYAYKVDAAQYKSNDRSGIDNDSTARGHFLSFSLEYGFGEPYK